MKQILILLAALLFLGGCANPSNIRFGGIEGIALRKVSSTGIDIAAMLNVENEGRKNLVVIEASGDIFLNDRKLGNITLTEPAVIPGRSDGTIEAMFRIRIARITLMDFPELLIKETPLILKGHAKAGIMHVKFEKEIHVPNFRQLISSAYRE